MKTFLKVWAKLTGQKIVYLRDFDNEITLTLAFHTPFGWCASRYGRNLILESDGKTSGVSYVKEWREAE